MPITRVSPDEEYIERQGRGSGRAGRVLPYPSPFFDLAQTYFPDNIKELFQYCIYYYNTNCVVPAIVNKMAAYPITSFVYTAVKDKTIQQKWKYLFEDHLNLQFTLYEAGMDMGVYGNCFLGVYLPFKRYLICPECHSTHPMNSYKDLKVRAKKMELVGECRSCHRKVTFNIKDKYIRSINGISIIRYDPMSIDIISDPVSGERRYVWDPPSGYCEALQEGTDMKLWEKAPKVVLDSIREEKRVVLRKDLFYHLRRPSLAGQSASWGYPLIMHALKSLYYLQTLKRAQEAVAVQHIVPLWVLFPQAANGSSLPPAANIGLGKWKTNVEEELKKWRMDPNYIPVFNIPVGSTSIGGEGRALLLGPEVQQEVQQVIASMGVPQEFVFGGMTWTGSSITLRMLENTFQGTRDGMQRFIKFLVNIFSKYLHYANVDIYMSELKMADDIQRQQIAVNLEATGKISTSRMLSEFGYDYIEEKRLKQEEAAGRLTDYIRDAVTQAKAQGEASLVSLDFQLQGQKKQVEAEGDMMVAQTVAQAEAQQRLMEKGLMPPAPQDPNAQGGEQPSAEGEQQGGQEQQQGEEQIDPQTGLPIDPNTGMPYDPQTGYLFDPTTNQFIDPATGQPVDQQGMQMVQSQDQQLQAPQQQQQQPAPQVDPTTGFPIDPNSGFPVDPNTGYLIDMQANAALDPNGMIIIDLTSGQQITPQEYAARKQQAVSLNPAESAGSPTSLQAAPMQKMSALDPANTDFNTARRQAQEQRAKEGLASGTMPPSVKAMVTSLATDVLALDPAGQRDVLMQMQNEMPTTASLVKRRMMEMQELRPAVNPPRTPDADTIFKSTTRNIK